MQGISTSKIRIIFATAVMMFAGISVLYADGNDANIEEMIEKHQQKVDLASDKDWKTPAQCAFELMQHGITSKEIAAWINRSISIKGTVFNHVVKGDYLVKTGKFQEAKSEYIEAVRIAQAEGKTNEIAAIQWKILVAMGTENYTNFQSMNQ